MTKKVRVENADNSTYVVVVQVWEKGRDGAPDTLSSETELPYAAMITEPMIHSTRYVVVKEKGAAGPEVGGGGLKLG